MNPNLILITERFVGMSLIVVGLSHILAARAWAAFMTEAFARSWAPLALGLPALWFGLAIVLLHNVWVAHFAVLTTIVGWGSTAKGALYLLGPEFPVAAWEGFITPGKFRIGGVIALVVGALIAINAFTAPG